MPELVHELLGAVAHAQAAQALVAHDQARHHDGQRTAKVEHVRRRIAAHHAGQGDQHLDLVVVDAAHESEGDPAQQGTEGDAAEDLHAEELQHLAHQVVVRGLARGDAEDGEEDHHAHAVVEERLAHDLGLELLRHPGLLQHAQYGDGIGGADQRPEEQAMDEGHGMPDGGEDPVGEGPHEEGAGEHAHGGEDQDGPALLLQLVPVGMHGPGEEQEAEHDVQHHGLEVDLAHHVLGVAQQGVVDGAGEEEPHGEEDGHQHEPDGVGQAEEPDVHVAEGGREHHEQGGDQEEVHGAKMGGEAGGGFMQRRR